MNDPVRGLVRAKSEHRCQIMGGANDARDAIYVFRDQTAGKTTYAAARYVYSDLSKDGKVIIDFNKATSPPCAFTSYATCPLPPPQNRMALAITAGETLYGTSKH